MLFGGTVPPNSVLFSGTIPPNSMLFGGTVPPNSVLFGGTVQPNSVLFGGTVPPNSVLFGGTVPPNSFPQKNLNRKNLKDLWSNNFFQVYADYCKFSFCLSRTFAYLIIFFP